MAERPIVYLVFFDGLARTVIDSTVLDHARQLAQLGIACFEILSFCLTRKIYQESVEKLHRAQEWAQCPVRLLPAVRAGLPFSVAINAKILHWELGTLN